MENANTSSTQAVHMDIPMVNQSTQQIQNRHNGAPSSRQHVSIGHQQSQTISNQNMQPSGVQTVQSTPRPARTPAIIADQKLQTSKFANSRETTTNYHVSKPMTDQNLAPVRQVAPPETTTLGRGSQPIAKPSLQSSKYGSGEGSIPTDGRSRLATVSNEPMRPSTHAITQAAEAHGADSASPARKSLQSSRYAPSQGEAAKAVRHSSVGKPVTSTRTSRNKILQETTSSNRFPLPVSKSDMQASIPGPSLNHLLKERPKPPVASHDRRDKNQIPRVGLGYVARVVGQQLSGRTISQKNLDRDAAAMEQLKAKRAAQERELQVAERLVRLDISKNKRHEPPIAVMAPQAVQTTSNATESVVIDRQTWLKNPKLIKAPYDD